LEKDAKLLDLKRRLEEMNEKFNNQENKRRNKIARVRKHFYAKGLTPQVQKMIEKLVDELEGLL
jgi:hypothetical protein